MKKLGGMLVGLMVIFGVSRQALAIDKMNAAVLDFTVTDGVAPSIVTSIVDEIQKGLVASGRFKILDRSKVEEVLKEQSFQKSGCTTQECAVEVGKLLNMRKMILGSVSRLADRYGITIKLLDVETSEILTVDGVECNSDRLIREASQALAEHFVQLIPVEGKVMGLYGENDNKGRSGTDVVINIGSKDNLENFKEQTDLLVKREDKEIGKIFFTIGKIKVKEIQPERSIANVVSIEKGEKPILKDDVVILPQVKVTKLKPFLSENQAAPSEVDAPDAPVKKRRAETVQTGGDTSTGRIFAGGFNGGGFMRSGVEDANGNVLTPRSSSGLMLTQHAQFGMEFGWAESPAVDFSFPLVFETTELTTAGGTKVTDISWFVMGVGFQTRFYPFSFSGGERGFFRPAFSLGYMGYGGTYDPDTKDSLVGPAFLIGHGALVGVGLELGPLFLEFVFRPFASVEGSFKDRRPTSSTFNKYLVREFDLSGSGGRLGLRW